MKSKQIAGWNISGQSFRGSLRYLVCVNPRVYNDCKFDTCIYSGLKMCQKEWYKRERLCSADIAKQRVVRVNIEHMDDGRRLCFRIDMWFTLTKYANANQNKFLLNMSPYKIPLFYFVVHHIHYTETEQVRCPKNDILIWKIYAQLLDFSRFHVLIY